jgi:hypothetical protein
LLRLTEPRSGKPKTPLASQRGCVKTKRLFLAADEQHRGTTEGEKLFEVA